MLTQCILLHRSVTIHNRSDVVVRFEWKGLATEEDEQIEKEMYAINNLLCNILAYVITH